MIIFFTFARAAPTTSESKQVEDEERERNRKEKEEMIYHTIHLIFARRLTNALIRTSLTRTSPPCGLTLRAWAMFWYLFAIHWDGMSWMSSDVYFMALSSPFLFNPSVGGSQDMIFMTMTMVQGEVDGSNTVQGLN